jgi:hypothetical protein
VAAGAWPGAGARAGTDDELPAVAGGAAWPGAFACIRGRAAAAGDRTGDGACLCAGADDGPSKGPAAGTCVTTAFLSTWRLSASTSEGVGAGAETCCPRP